MPLKPAGAFQKFKPFTPLLNIPTILCSLPSKVRYQFIASFFQCKLQVFSLTMVQHTSSQPLKWWLATCPCVVFWNPPVAWRYSNEYTHEIGSCYDELRYRCLSTNIQDFFLRLRGNDKGEWVQTLSKLEFLVHTNHGRPFTHQTNKWYPMSSREVVSWQNIGMISDHTLSNSKHG